MQPFLKPEVVSKTTFTQNEETKLWLWETKAINGDVIANAQEGKGSLRESIQQFFLTHGINYIPLETGWPQNFGPLSFAPYQINKYLSS